MSKEISSKRIDILTKLGFGTSPLCDPTIAFGCFNMAFNTKMIVRGDHADDVAYIYYSCVEIDGKEYDGLFFAPSILEHPYLNYQIFDVNKVIDEINHYAFCDAEYVSGGGIGMIFVPVSEYDWNLDIKDPISDMLKIIGITDYIFTCEYERQFKLHYDE